MFSRHKLDLDDDETISCPLWLCMVCEFLLVNEECGGGGSNGWQPCNVGLDQYAVAVLKNL